MQNLTVPAVIGFVFLCCGLIYAVYMLRDIFRDKQALKDEKGKLPVIMALEVVVYILCTLGVSDFLMNTLVVRKLRLADDARLPDCLISAALVPGTIIAFMFLRTGSTVDVLTLIVFMVCLGVGSFFGSRFVGKLDGATIRKALVYALSLALVALIAKIIVSAGATGTLTGLSGTRLVIMGITVAAIGFINMLGVPTKPITTTLLLLLGMSPITTLTMVLVLGSISPVTGGINVAKRARYNKKLTLSAITAGSAAAIIGCLLAISIDATVLNILLIAVIAVAIISLIDRKKA